MRKVPWRVGATLAFATLFGACIHSPAPGVGEPVPFTQLPGWRDDAHAQAWPALQQSCKKLGARNGAWRELCRDATLFPEMDDATARAFFETRFEPRVVRPGNGRLEGTITGYYEPLLYGSLTRSERFRYPLYRRPDDLVTIDVGELYPELKGKTLRGRLAGQRVVPYFSRAEISNGTKPLKGNELLWVDDAVALFFLQVQGSGRVQLPDGKLLYVGYADQNGHPYQSIGTRLIELGALKREDVNLDSIRAWLKAHPNEAEGVLNQNPSYVFFGLRENGSAGPLGSLNVPLTAQRSIAVDPAYLSLGAPVWLDTTLPVDGQAPYRRLMLAQDTGGAIKGAVRADVFFGFGPEAERLAGNMKQPGALYLLLPRERRVYD